MPVTQEGPDRLVTLLSCPCSRSWRSRRSRSNQEARHGCARRRSAPHRRGRRHPQGSARRGGRRRAGSGAGDAIASPATRQGYRQMLAWMRSFGEVQRVGVESTGSYGAGLLRFLQQAGIAVLEVTTPDRQDRRRRGKNDDLRRPECGACGLRRHANRHAEKPGRDDRGVARLERLPEDRGGGAARRPADDPKHHRVRAGRACERCCAA